MESTQRLTNSTDVIAFLAQRFPQCFSTEGEAKPLKIGIFHDIASQLEEDDAVSKTVLRSSLRHYTNSWRYLHCVKEGAFRVDLDGNHTDQIEKEHADHAAKQLKESKEKAAERRKATVKPNAKNTARNKKAEIRSDSKGTKKPLRASKPKQPPPLKLDESTLKTGTEVTVKLGKIPVKGTITEVAKDGVYVSLESGMAVKVEEKNLRLAASKR